MADTAAFAVGILLTAIDEVLLDRGKTLLERVEQAAKLLHEGMQGIERTRLLDEVCRPAWRNGYEFHKACKEYPSKVFYGIVRLCALLLGSTRPFTTRTVPGRVIHMCGQYLSRACKPNAQVQPKREQIWGLLRRGDPELWRKWQKILADPVLQPTTKLSQARRAQLQMQADLLAEPEIQASWEGAVEGAGEVQRKGVPQALRCMPRFQAHLNYLIILPEGLAVMQALYLCCLITACHSVELEPCTLNSFRISLLTRMGVNRGRGARLNSEPHQAKPTQRTHQALVVEMAECLGNQFAEDSAANTEALRQLLTSMATIKVPWQPPPK